VAGGKYRLAIAKRIGRVDVTLDDIVVHQAVDNVGAFPIRGAKDQRVP
jgi:hypothetical protein